MVRNELSRSGATDSRTQATIEIHRESLHFSVAHFTIFSDSKRENLHGHNYTVKATVTGPIGDNGLCFDYTIVKNALQKLCDSLDEKTLLPECSPHLQLLEDADYWIATFDNTKLPFLKRDVKVLPVRNISVEELAMYFLKQLTSAEELRSLPIDEIVLAMASGPGQTAISVWRRLP